MEHASRGSRSDENVTRRWHSTQSLARTMPRCGQFTRPRLTPCVAPAHAIQDEGLRRTGPLSLVFLRRGCSLTEIVLIHRTSSNQSVARDGALVIGRMAPRFGPNRTCRINWPTLSVCLNLSAGVTGMLRIIIVLVLLAHGLGHSAC